MTERQAPWRARPTPAVLDLLSQLGDTRLYVMQRSGPTSFVIHEDACNLNRKVMIGCRPTCTCGSGGKELCLHVLFVMVKVLRVPPSNPIVWQLSLTDRELEEVLRCSALPTIQQPSGRSAAEASAGRGRLHGGHPEPGAVQRKPLDEEEPCPICYEDMAGVDVDALVWCKHSCGRNIHGKCMSVWSDHQVRTLCKELTCPLCRADWGPFLWRPPPPKRKAPREERRDVHYGTRCGSCRKVRSSCGGKASGCGKAVPGALLYLQAGAAGQVRPLAILATAPTVLPSIP